MTAITPDTTPDPRVIVKPFRHPYIPGEGFDPECGRRWHDHGWIDFGSHGLTVCPVGYPLDGRDWNVVTRDPYGCTCRCGRCGDPTEPDCIAACHDEEDACPSTTSGPAADHFDYLERP